MSKTILVTGASGSIGRETALELAQAGHTVLLHGRNPKKTQAVYNEIRTAVPGAKLEWYTADLSELASVVAFAKTIQAKHTQLDVLINNAGGQFGTKREETTEGHEKTLAINVLAPFLLTKLLLPQLSAGRGGRVVTVSSLSYQQGGKPIFDDFELRDHYSFIRAYGLSKLYVWWIMRRFAAVGPTNVTFNTCEPGSTPSDLGRISGAHGWGRIMMTLWRPFTQSVEKSAATSVYLATNSAVQQVTGGFYGKLRPLKIKSKWFSESGEKRIWAYCQQVCAPFLTE